MSPDSEQQPIVMVVDDIPANLQLLENMLVNSNYRVLLFTKGELALKAAEKSPPDVVLLDINMPGMDGYQVCERFKASPQLSDIPVIFVSGLNETMDKVRAFSIGGVDYITKPYQFEEVHARLDTHLKIRNQQRKLERYSHHLEDLVQAQVQEITRSQTATIAALAKLAESRDDDTGMHIERVRHYCVVIARHMAEHSPCREEISSSFIEALFQAAPLHDIGKVAIPDSVLLKPGKLTAEEFDVMKRHTLIGARTLAAIHAKYPKNAFIRAGLSIARSHHERWDGGGYPDGARGTEISLHARIMAVCDVYDALRSDRCYRKALPHEEVCAMIESGSGSQFDPQVATAFHQIADEFLRISQELADSEQ